MSKKRISILAIFACLCFAGKAGAQSMHFSQYYNAPLLLNPANAGLMPEYDFRLGANYRNQWATLPVPYKTMSAFGDLKIGGNREGEHPNWIGLGGALFTDKAGDGERAKRWRHRKSSPKEMRNVTQKMVRSSRAVSE